MDYRSSGVNIDEGNRFITLIKSMAESTYTEGVLGSLGGFAGFFSLKDAAGMTDPVLVAATDGVGTKLKIAFDSGKLDTVGVDLVAMSVNDLVVTGAKPLFFLDYLATGKLAPEDMAEVVKGIADGCRQSGTALIGGETAEMPGFYKEGEFDLAGFCVGILDKAKMVDGSKVSAGDAIVGFGSTGLHSNGYSLARKIFFDELKMDVKDEINGKPLYELLLAPTKIYVKTVLTLLSEGFGIKAMAHITGGGFYENIPRVLPEGLKAVVDKDSFAMPEIFGIITSKVSIDSRELYRVFNMGIGFIAVVPADEAGKLRVRAEELGEKAFIIGRIAEGVKSVEIKGIDF
ncbi:phosphoribosylformylglycinamidine cyclo-ligase [Geovibrio thiophilus]|uniref:Phosphoribosylformylglycinamidine cyclo-ligase n=1 Tax=Geovibrio thiophilus TaxID=139438 RepID=A0A410K1Z9_9BACT|nr:phosphoribosylformylglycinamidine cyclo-ligase [Geovibrio thiophilus]